MPMDGNPTSSFLAGRAPAGRPSADGLAGQGRSARAVAAIFPSMREEPRIGRRSPIFSDDAHGLTADEPSLSPEDIRFTGRQRACEAAWIELGAPEDLVSHPVAHAWKEVLHEEERLERAAWPAIKECV